jgi:chromosome segregation ATPase
MANYHPTDTTGQAIVEARRALDLLGPALGDLDRELAEERHMHRVEVVRLVERAEGAEREATRSAELVQSARLALDTVQRERDQARQVHMLLVREVLGLPADTPVRQRPEAADLLAAVREVVERADAAELSARSWEDRADATERARAEIERERDEEREARRNAEDRADDAEREQRLAEGRVRDLERELATERRRAERAEEQRDDLERELATERRRAERAEEQRDDAEREARQAESRLR